MDNNSFKSVFYIDMTPTHSVAFYGLHSEKTPYIKRGPIFNTTTDLSGHADSDIGATAVSAIASFGIGGVKVRNIECGPVVTRINLELPYGTRIKAVESLADDIAMQLKVKSVAFTQVPENGVLALDIPSTDRKVVRLGNVHTANIDGMALPLELGVNVTGEARAIDLARSPHLLIAGQTGSGKSVCVNSIICSLLRNVSMADFDLMLVDPKGVELNDYAKMPNCINGKVLVTPDESLSALRWLCVEMDRRYQLLTKYNCRNISTYNEWVGAQPVGVDCAEKMRYVVCVVDEFADLMMTAGTELTEIVQRLAQKSRAVGIHLVLATQRPSTKVVTGDLKANLPSRIAFKVSSAVDSVTIIGHGGAEHLLGKGDMIISTDSGEERLHGVYITDEEIRYFTRIVYSSTVSSILRTVDYATGEWSNTLGTPSWVLETMSECGHRSLAANAPTWLKTLVDVNRKVWNNADVGSDFCLGLLACRMAKYYMDVESIRLYAEQMLAPSVSEVKLHVGSGWSRFFDIVMNIARRLSTQTIFGLGFIVDNVHAAQRHTIPYNEEANFLTDVA